MGVGTIQHLTYQERDGKLGLRGISHFKESKELSRFPSPRLRHHHLVFHRSTGTGSKSAGVGLKINAQDIKNNYSENERLGITANTYSSG
jgi:hypothetical protein